MIVSRVLKLKGDDGVVSVPPGTLLGEVVRILAQRRIGAVVISADGLHADGIVSETDIIRALALHGMVCLIDPVEAIMTVPVTTCSRRERVETVLSRMTSQEIRHVPVVERGVMVGLISSSDMMRARLGEDLSHGVAA